MNTEILELIKVVNDNYNHIAQLEALCKLLNTPETEDEHIICKTTHNSHYDYKLFTTPKFQHPENYINNFILMKGGAIIGVDNIVFKTL